VSWRDVYRQASFRGVAFNVEASSTDHGRNLVPHEYPGRELPWIEDLGRRATTFQVEAFLVGANYHLERDRLIEALSQAGAGELVHPYRGTLQATVLGHTVRETVDEGGMCRIGISFLEAGKAVYPTGPRSAGRATSRQANRTTAAAANTFPATQPQPGAPGHVLEASEQSWLEALREMSRMRVKELEQLRRVISEAGEDVVETIAEPVLFARRVIVTVAAIAGTAAGQLEAVRLYLRLALLPTPLIRGTSDGSDQARVAGAGVTDLVRRCAMAEAARAAATATYASHEEAVATRDEVLDVLDVVEETAPDEILLELEALRRELVGAVPPEDSRLPRVDHYEPASMRPALVIAYTLYDDVDRMQELVDRNHLPHPGFVTGNEPIEVLVDAG